jgi:pimeloyl-ACP methyl ester carboxylesterase
MVEAGLAGKDVMLVGHSQDGMVSTSLAADPDFTRQFNVQHVVTAGSPTAQVPHLPDSTHALHLENRGDAVPLLDGEDNPDQPHRTTVGFDSGGTNIADNHGLDHYTRGAAAADASTNGSIRDQVERMRDDGFLGAGPSGPVQTWVITR